MGSMGGVDNEGRTVGGRRATVGATMFYGFFIFFYRFYYFFISKLIKTIKKRRNEKRKKNVF